GLLENSAAAGPNSGYIAVTPTRLGGFTGNLNFAGQLVRLHGFFDVGGNFTTTIGRIAQRHVDIALHFDPSTDSITGTVVDGTNTSNILAEPCPRAEQLQVVKRGHYTMLIQPSVG